MKYWISIPTQGQTQAFPQLFFSKAKLIVVRTYLRQMKKYGIGNHFFFFSIKDILIRRWYIGLFVSSITKKRRSQKSYDNTYEKVLSPKNWQKRFAFPSQFFDFLLAGERPEENFLQFYFFVLQTNLVVILVDMNLINGEISFKKNNFTGQRSWAFLLKTLFRINFVQVLYTIFSLPAVMSVLGSEVALRPVSHLICDNAS